MKGDLESEEIVTMLANLPPEGLQEILSYELTVLLPRFF